MGEDDNERPIPPPERPPNPPPVVDPPYTPRPPNVSNNDDSIVIENQVYYDYYPRGPSVSGPSGDVGGTGLGPVDADGNIDMTESADGRPGGGQFGGGFIGQQDDNGYDPFESQFGSGMLTSSRVC